jgi:fucose permease
LRTASLWGELADVEPAQADRAHVPMRGPMLASVLLFFLYGGLEAGAGLWTTSLLIGTRGTSPAVAGSAVALFWAALTLGRVAIGLRADAIGPARALRYATYLALLASSALALPSTPVWFVCLALAALGLSLAPIYPLAMHDTPSRFGARWGTKLVGYQVATASLGVAILPWLIGALAQRLSLSTLPLCFVVLALLLIVLQHARRSGSEQPASL